MVSRQKVEKVAQSARLNLTDEEVENFSEEFDQILEIFDALEQIDTEDVEPAFHPVEVEPEQREDEEEQTLPQEQAFQNTENEENGMFKGPSA
ncbi:MAG: Asp-tRNA(Asn)/Glu-tRNA(Gln) amidotransferase subunit GatC [Candidatus Nanohaloarchaea archaeon]